MSLRFGILGILTDASMTGYNLKKTFDTTIGYLWTASLSQIYRELGVLEKEGFITSAIEIQEDRPDKKVYSITDNGTEAFQNWLSDFPDNLSSTKRDAFMLRIFFGSLLQKEEIIIQFNRFIEQKKKYIEQLKELEDVVRQQSQDESKKLDSLFQKFTIKRALMTLQTIIDWANECMEELQEFDK